MTGGPGPPAGAQLFAARSRAAPPGPRPCSTSTSNPPPTRNRPPNGLISPSAPTAATCAPPATTSANGFGRDTTKDREQNEIASRYRSSGTVHQEAGGAIHIPRSALPAMAEARLFDVDDKLIGELLAKIYLLAHDDRLVNPVVLAQIVRRPD